MIWEIQYMVDPGDGIISKQIIQEAGDLIEDVVAGWRDSCDPVHDPYFIVSCACLGDDSE